MIYFEHMKGRKVTKTSWNIAITVAIVFVASLFAVLVNVPEQLYVRSSDSVVTLDAVTREGGVEIVRYESVDAEVDYVYEIQTSLQTYVQDGVLTFDLSESNLDLTEQSLYRFENTSLEWVELETIFDLVNKTLNTSIEFSGNILVGVATRR